MATVVKQIEKEFLISMLYSEQIPVRYLRNRTEYVFKVISVVGKEIQFHINQPITGLKPRMKMTLLFTYKNIQFSCSVVTITVTNEYVRTFLPDVIYTNLDRSYARVIPPPVMEVQCYYNEDRYVLPFPQLAPENVPILPAANHTFKNTNEAFKQLATWIHPFFDNLQVISFRGENFTGTEERLISDLGKIIYLPSIDKGFPRSDSSGRLVTYDLFKQYLENKGQNASYLDQAIAQLLASKAMEGVICDLWIPMFFLNYVVGCIHLWKMQTDKVPFKESDITILNQYAASLVSTMQSEGYFVAGYINKKLIKCQVIDMSVSGFRIAYPDSSFSSTLKLNGEITVEITCAKRSISVQAKIVRQYRTNVAAFVGCRFLNLKTEDLRFLFEFLYGKQFTNSDDDYLSGSV
ncbi:hypothetical protein FACS1894172_03520 [Spirochaetia bacterium]|nr:hypothetical protein FACS1894172_03520 [Spirochaetia bacterium]